MSMNTQGRPTRAADTSPSSIAAPTFTGNRGLDVDEHAVDAVLAQRDDLFCQLGPNRSQAELLHHVGELVGFGRAGVGDQYRSPGQCCSPRVIATRTRPTIENQSKVRAPAGPTSIPPPARPSISGLGRHRATTGRDDAPASGSDESELDVAQ